MKKIVLIDDDTSMLEAMTIMLEGVGYSVMTLSNGERILSHEPLAADLFIIDRQLAGVDGLDICRYIKNQNNFKEIPVIMMSASPNIHALAKNAMANAALEKPFSMKDLRNLVAECFRLKALLFKNTI